MGVEFRELSRGRAMVFVRIVASGDTDAGRLVAQARTDGGDDLPACLVDQGIDGERVLVVPQVDVPSTAWVGEGGGSLSELRLDPRRVRRTSQLNTLMRSAAAERVRNADTKVRRSSGAIHMREVVPDWRAQQVIVRGVAEGLVPEGPSDGAGPARVELVVLGRDGRPIKGADCTLRFDVAAGVDGAPDAALRRLGFSFRLPLEPPDAIIWARGMRCEDGDVFLALTSDDLRRRRDDFAVSTCPAMSDAAYGEWFRSHQATREELAWQRSHSFGIEPTFSLVVPLFETPVGLFREMAASALGQTYAKLQLVLVNASPGDAELAAAVRDVAASDPRVTVVALEGNLGITENTNRGIRVATGEFVAFLDHDDLLEPDLLFEYARGINAHPNTDLLYCDEDLLQDGQLSRPFLKPDWDPDLLCSMNYVTHLLCVRRSLMDELGPASSDVDGAQDHNLTLAAGERARNVYHVRKPLYHWRASASSTAAAPDAKPYTEDAGLRAVQGHLDRVGVTGTAVAHPYLPNAYRIEHDLSGSPLVSVVIPADAGEAALARCLESLRGHATYPSLETVVVRGEGSHAQLLNRGVAQAHGEYLLVLRGDVEVIADGWLEGLLGPCTMPGVDVVGPKLLDADGTILSAGVAFHQGAPQPMSRCLPHDSLDYFNYNVLAHDSAAVVDACLLTTRDLWDALGGMDEAFCSAYSDVDYCMRAWRLGRRVVYQPDVEVRCHGAWGLEVPGPARARRFADEALLMSRYPERYATGDPLQNPNVEGPYHHLRW